MSSETPAPLAADDPYLNWESAGPGVIYRINIRNEITGERKTIYEGTQTRCRTPMPRRGAAFTFRVEIRQGDEDESKYRTFQPYMPVDPGEDDPSRLLEWTPADEPMTYRVSLLNETTNVSRGIYEGSEPRCRLPFAASSQRAPFSYRVEMHRPDEGESAYKTLHPYQPVPDPWLDEEAADVVVWPSTGADRYRLEVRNETSGAPIFERVGNEPRFRLYAAEWPIDSIFLARLSALEDGAWVLDRQVLRIGSDTVEAARMRFSTVALGEGRSANLVAAAQATLRLPNARVSPGKGHGATWLGQGPGHGGVSALITVDVDIDLRLSASADLDEAAELQIFGRGQGRPGGIGLIMDRLDSAGLKGVFFVDVLLEYAFGQSVLEEAISTIADRGHDIELRLRPSPNLQLTHDDRLIGLGDAWRRGPSPDLMRQLLDIAAPLFERRIGQKPIAVRLAGGMPDSLFEVLGGYGLKFDSSDYTGAVSAGVSTWLRGRTLGFHAPGDIVELPVTRILSRGSRLRNRVNTGPITAAIDPATDIIGRSIAALAAARVTTPLVLTLASSSLQSVTADAKSDAAWAAGIALLPPVFRKALDADLDHAPRPGALGPVDERQVTDLDRMTIALQRVKDLRNLTFRQLADFGDLQTLSPPASFEPIYEFSRDQRQGRMIALRRYGADYLDALQRGGAYLDD